MADQQTQAQTPESGFSIVNAISLIIVVAYLGAIPLWMWQPPMVPPEVLSILNNQMGGLQMAFAAVIGYHIGSSKGSKDAQQTTRETLSKMSDTVVTTAATAATVANTAAAVAGTGSGSAGLVNGAAESAAWQEATTANTADAFQAYLGKFPAGIHAADAMGRIASLRPAPPLNP